MSRARIRRLVAGSVVAAALTAMAPHANAEICRYYIIAGHATRVCIPIEP